MKLKNPRFQAHAGSTVIGACTGEQRKRKRPVALVVGKEKNVRLEIVQGSMAEIYVMTVDHFHAVSFCKGINVSKNTARID
jgi:hypothetical protein